LLILRKFTDIKTLSLQFSICFISWPSSSPTDWPVGSVFTLDAAAVLYTPFFQVKSPPNGGYYFKGEIIQTIPRGCRYAIKIIDRNIFKKELLRLF
jgi:hypothetical protein